VKVKLIDAQNGQQDEEDAIAIDPDDNTSHAKIINQPICIPIARLAKRL